MTGSPTPRRTRSSRAGLPITHVFTGNFKPLPLGAHVWGFDNLAYSYTYNRVLYLRKVKVTIDFVPVP